jgi:hypothetical protein
VRNITDNFLFVQFYSSCNLPDFFQLITYLSPQFFFPYTVTILLMWHVIDFLTFTHQFYTFFLHFGRKIRQRSLRPHTQSTLEETVMDLRIRIEGVPRLVVTRAVPSNFLARRRNGTETWRRFMLTETFLSVWTYPFNTHEKILLNGDVPRQSGNVNQPLCVTFGFRREVNEKCAVLGYYAARSGSFLPTFQDNLSVPS